MTIMIGKNLTKVSDALEKVEEDFIYNALRTPIPEVEEKIRQLRIVYTLSVLQYAQLKRTLPYFVCGVFNPAYRRKENFAYTDCFIIDIDKLHSKEIDLVSLRKSLQSDSQVRMCFKSPSEDGLKIMFRLAERCYDVGMYSVFYRSFVSKFAMRHNIEQVVDLVTCDVTRACFMSVDPEVYYNPNSEPVELEKYVDVDNVTSFFDQKREQEKQVREMSQLQQADVNRPSEPVAEVVARIKALLHPNARPTKTPTYVPQILNDIIDDLCSYLQQLGFVVVAVIDINYGKKLQLRLAGKQAETNLFYGRKGFTVVQSPRSGTDKEINELAVEVIQNYIACNL